MLNRIMTGTKCWARDMLVVVAALTSMHIGLNKMEARLLAPRRPFPVAAVGPTANSAQLTQAEMDAWTDVHDTFAQLWDAVPRHQVDGELELYWKGLRANASAFRAALLACRDGDEFIADRTPIIQLMTRDFVAMKALMSPDWGVDQFVKGHNKALGTYITLYEAGLVECEDEIEPPPPIGGDPDWRISPDPNGGWLIEDVNGGTVTRVPSYPVMTVYGADHRSTSAQNRPPMKKPGDVIELTPGREYDEIYLSMSYDYDPALDKNGNGKVDGVAERAFGQDPQTTIRASGPGVRIKERSGGDLLYHEWNGAVTVEGVEFGGSGRASVKTENPGTGTGGGRWNNGLAHQGFRDIEYRDCSIIGPTDGHTGTVAYQYGKWGTQAYELGPSSRGTYGFIWSGGVIQGMEPQNGEHAFYFHNSYATDASGNPDPNGLAILIENATIRWCMRTAVQDVNRYYEGPDGKGTIHVKNCYIEDVCLEQGGGGSALTFRGNRDGKVLIEGTTVRLGCDPQLAPRFQPNITGAMVVDQGSGTRGNGTREVVITGCRFEVGLYYPGANSAIRELVNLSSIDRLEIEDTTLIAHPLRTRAVLKLDLATIKSMELDDDCVVVGDVVLVGKGTFKDDARDGSGWRAALAALAGTPGVVID